MGGEWVARRKEARGLLETEEKKSEDWEFSEGGKWEK